MAMAAGGDAGPSRAPPGSRNWSELPLDAIASVLAKLGAMDILMGAGLVCRSWLRAAEEPSLWRHLDMLKHNKVVEKNLRCGETGVLCAMAKKAADRSGGQLEVFVGEEFVDDDLLKYIGARAPSLRVLRLTSCPNILNEGFMEAMNKFPLLEELKLSACQSIGGRATYEAVGKACGNLKRLELKDQPWKYNYLHGDNYGEEAYGIATMHGLRSLKISRSNLTNKALAAILGNNPHLESIDLYYCYNINMDDAMRSKCAGIKVSVKWHNGSVVLPLNC
ncbi:unnamed protein product [Urochloa decumbens]|uniref:F-box domain-containing protein n=1 Tax=Urochloa decumbens TaxID=240449 RepID=A0ABC9BTI1_9POAL